jgi:hypothetical protein
MAQLELLSRLVLNTLLVYIVSNKWGGSTSLCTRPLLLEEMTCSPTQIGITIYLANFSQSNSMIVTHGLVSYNFPLSKSSL